MIEPSKSHWAFRVVMAKKKGTQLRFCCDFPYLNAVTIEDAYPIPLIDGSLSKLGDANFFTSRDLGCAFWKVPIRKRTEKRLDLQVNWAAPVEKDSLRLVQCHGDLLKSDGSGFEQSNEEVRESSDALRG